MATQGFTSPRLAVPREDRLSAYPVFRALVGLSVFLLGCGGDSGGVIEPGTTEPEPFRPCSAALLCEGRISLGSGAFLPVYSTHSLDDGLAKDSTLPARAVVVIHGNERNANDYFDRVVAAAEQAEQLARTVIVAPRFQTQDDRPALDEPYWTSRGWKRGYPSEGNRIPSISSYAALDTLLLRLTNASLFPDVSRVVVSGHSAGGQVVHRYAAGSGIEEELSGITVRYVVANPSTYLYPTPVREIGPHYVVPAAANCPAYDSWHYGFEDLTPYMRETGAEPAKERLLRRDVIIFLGEQDTGTASLDDSCGAFLQGANRLQRGLTLLRTLDHVFAGHRHRKVTVPGAGTLQCRHVSVAAGPGAVVWGVTCGQGVPFPVRRRAISFE